MILTVQIVLIGLTILCVSLIVQAIRKAIKDANYLFKWYDCVDWVTVYLLFLAAILTFGIGISL